MSSEEKTVNLTEAEFRAGISRIASPLADEKLTGRALKLVRKAAKAKLIRRGVKEVIKGLRKNEKGLMILAGNVTPIDVISHIPVLCEENNIPYIYVPAKEDLGAASTTKRPTSVVLVMPSKDPEYMESYEKVKKGILSQQPDTD